METLTIGDVVVTRFPFSNLSAHKNRPALVVGISDFNDIVLCQITSISDGKLKKVLIDNESFKHGKLPVISYIRPDKLFTADRSIISSTVGRLKNDKIQEVRLVLKEFFSI